MSTNTSNTREPAIANPEAAESSLTSDRLSAALAALPDTAEIARMANEFFHALPGNPAPTAATAAPEPAPDAVAAARGAPVGTALLAPETPVPATPPVAPASFYFLDAQQGSPWSAPPAFPAVLSFPVVPGVQAWESAPDSIFASASEDDLRNAPGAPVGTSTVFAAQAPTAAQPPAVAGAPAIFKEPTFPADFPGDFPRGAGPGTAFAFPGVPDFTNLGGVPLDSASPAAEPAFGVTPWSGEIQFPADEQFFALPAIPAARSAPEPVPVAPAESELRDFAKSLAGDSPLSPHAPATPVVPQAPVSTPYFLDAKKVGDSAAQPRLPERSEMFALPNVPGMQSPPGAPPLPAEDDPAAVSRPPFSPERMITFVTDLSSGLRGTDQKAAAEVAAPATKRDSSEVSQNIAPSRKVFDPHLIRRDFPVLQERVHGKPLIWLDNAATTQKPQAVIDRISYFYEHENSNIHRAAHTLAARATDAYESAREKVRRFLNAPSTKEIVFVRGTTEAINLAAQSWGKRHINQGDEIVISWIEHHSNIVPWQLLCAERGARLRVAPVDDDGQVILEEYEKLLNPKTRMVSITQVSNALGTILPVREMIQMAHRHGARVLVDGAQAIAHMRVDVQALDCDFYVFSGHKIFAPTGIGVLYGKPDALAESPPWQGGGSMIVDVTFEKSVYQTPPARFEAGTGNIADAVGLGAALDYLDEIGMETITRYEHDLLVYGMERLRQIPGLRLIGTAREKASVMSFVLDGYRTEDVGAALDREGIAVRAGHHCAQPSLRRFGLETTVRPSLALYNTYEDIDALVEALKRLQAWNERGVR